MPSSTEMFIVRRKQLTQRDVPASQSLRNELVALHDQWLQQLCTEAGISQSRVALVAVGGFGRQELCAGSDLDLLLLHHPDEAPSAMSAMAERLWYPIWDAGIALDHSVRNVSEARKLAGTDLKVVLGLLDARTVAGDDSLLSGLRSSVLGDWRAMAKDRLPELQETVTERRNRLGDLSHLLEPDLKEAYGGLRDVTVLRAIAASWVTDIDHSAITPAAEYLLRIRDGLHRITGRPTDRLSMQEQAEVAALQSEGSDDELLKKVFVAGRTIAVASDAAWHRVSRITRKRTILKRLTPQRDERSPLVEGAVVQDGEVVLARDADPQHDATLVLRVAAAAAQAGLPLSPHTVSRLAAESATLKTPWPSAAREALVSLLGAGNGAIPVWEALDQAGIIVKLLPHWEVIRAAPQRNALHTYTVDRHSLEAAVQAAHLTRNVARPDLLLVGALFHDIGKARGDDHCGKGEVLMRQIAPVLGYGVADTEILAAMVKHHLLLPESATRRDLEDPATIEFVVDQVRSHELLDLLHNLTIADSLATGPAIYSDWKKRLLEDLVARCHAALQGEIQEASQSLIDRFPVAVQSSETVIKVSPDGQSLVLHIAMADRVGLVEAIAGAMYTLRLEVRSALLDTADGIAYQEWIVAPLFGDVPPESVITTEVLKALEDPALLEQRIKRLAVARPLRRGFIPPPPRIRHLSAASARSTVLEVRAHDAPALLYKLAAAVADHEVTITAARVLTLGSEVVDVLYVQNLAGNVLSDSEIDEVVGALGEALASDEQVNQ